MGVGGVEVRSTSGAWLTGATIVDYHDNKITVSFEKNDKPNEAFTVENVRFASGVTQVNRVDKLQIIYLSLWFCNWL